MKRPSGWQAAAIFNCVVAAMNGLMVPIACASLSDIHRLRVALAVAGMQLVFISSAYACQILADLQNDR